MVGLGQKGDTRRAFAATVTANYFSVLGVPPAQGRAFSLEEETPGHAVPVAIVSYGYWAKNIPSIRHCLARNCSSTATPVYDRRLAPRGFTGLMQIISPEVWLPLGVYDRVWRTILRARTIRSSAIAPGSCSSLAGLSRV